MLPDASRATFQGAQEKKVFPCRCAFRHALAEKLAMSVSFRRRTLDCLLMRSTSEGIPSGCNSLRTGLGGRATPRMGSSLAREKVAELGAKWQCVDVSKSRSNLSRSLKTFNPRRTSHGSRTTHLRLEEPDKASTDKQGPFTLLEAASGERPSP